MTYTSSEQGLSLSRTSFSSHNSCITEITRRLTNLPCFNLTNENTTLPIKSTSDEVNISPLIPPITPRTPTLIQEKQSSIYSGITIPTPYVKPTPTVVGKTYSLEKIQEHPSIHYARIGLFCTLLTCAIHFVYSIYKYKNICVSLFTIGSQHLPG